MSERQTVDERVWMTRVRLFFGHAIGNAARAGIGAAMSGVILWLGNTSPTVIGVWYAAVIAAALGVVALERVYNRTDITPSNARLWVNLRILSGAVIGILYGIAIFLLPPGAPYELVSFIFVGNLTMVALTALGYPTMPVYFLTLNATAMVPMMVYFLIRFEPFSHVLLVATILWQVMFLRKALDVSRANIQGIAAAEKLADEVVDHQRARDQIQYMAFHDSLTGLANRRQFQDSANHALRVASRAGSRIGLAVIDLDHFKPINDAYGHQAGDRVLKEVAERLRQSIRASDMVARLGGDEFGVLLENVNNPADVGEVARKIARTLNTPVIDGNSTIPLQASIGYAVFPADGNDLDTVFRIADQRMYTQKHGRSGNTIFH